MNTLSHASSENATKKSTSKTITSYAHASFSSKRSKTPVIKQANRYKKSSGQWKDKAVHRNLIIVAQEKTISEIRKSRESHKKQNKDILVLFEKLNLDLNLSKQKQIDERARGDKEEEKRLLAEAEVVNVNFRLEKAIEELKEVNRRMEMFSDSQTNLQDKITNINTEIDGYNFEILNGPTSTLTSEMSAKIQKGFLKLQNEVKRTESALQLEIKELKKQVSQNLALFNNSICKNLSNLYQQGISYANERIKRLTNNQKDIKDRLKSADGRFKNKKNRQGDFRTHKRAKNYSFSLLVIRLTLLFLINGALSIRAVAKVMGIQAIFLDFPTPCYTIISEWGKKIGFYIYNLPKDKSVDRLWIIDFSIQVGQDKLMLVLGVDISKIKNWKKHLKGNKGEKGKFKLCFKDVEILHKVVLKSTAYQITLKELNKVAEKCGPPFFILSDEGSDLAKGIRIFIENNLGVEHLHDISHKLSNILKAALEKNIKWKEFCEVVTHIKLKMKLSDIAELCPPKFRQKVRFLNVRDPIAWAVIMLNMDFKNFTAQQIINFKRYIQEPLEAFKEEIMQWDGYANFITFVETEIKHNGLTRGDGIEIRSTSEILANYLKGQRDPKKSVGIYDRILEFVKMQEAKLSPGQTIIGSSDIIESIFGKWKSMVKEDSMAGITDMILLLPLLTVNLTDDLIKNALENTPIQKIKDWKVEALGETMYSKRLKIFQGKNKTKTKKKTDKKLGEPTQRKFEKAA